MKTPAADIDVDHQLVARLVEAQHPDLVGPLERVASGWDNVLYRLGDDLCVRLPRRQVAVDLLVNEQRWLPVLAQQITVRIPVPVRRGAPSPDYPWPWTIAGWFDGRPAIEVPPPERSGIAAELARFMAELHTPAPPDAPRSPVRGVPLAVRDADVRVRLSCGVIPNSDVLLDLWDELVVAPPLSVPATWVHGDPHPANLLLLPVSGTGEQRLSAVIDFGDLNSGDPATDLAAAWMVFDAEGRATFKSRLDELTHAHPGRRASIGQTPISPPARRPPSAPATPPSKPTHPPSGTSSTRGGPSTNSSLKSGGSVAPAIP